MGNKSTTREKVRNLRGGLSSGSLALTITHEPSMIRRPESAIGSRLNRALFEIFGRIETNSGEVASTNKSSTASRRDKFYD